MTLRTTPTSTRRLHRVRAALLSLVLAGTLLAAVAPAAGARAANSCQSNVTMSNLDDRASGASVQVRGTVVCQKARAKTVLRASVTYRRNAKDSWHNITYGAGQPSVEKTCARTTYCKIGIGGGHGYDKRGWSGTYCATLWWKFGNGTAFRKVQHCRYLKDG